MINIVIITRIYFFLSNYDWLYFVYSINQYHLSIYIDCDCDFYEGDLKPNVPIENDNEEFQLWKDLVETVKPTAQQKKLMVSYCTAPATTGNI